MKIDLVVPWVNPEDKKWQQDYKKTFGSLDIDQTRFRELGLFKYMFRCIEKNAPWINNVWVILSRESQKPDWFSDKVKVIYHEDFIPKEFLPIFNSAGIEQFLPFLPEEVSEYFIYSNDDFYINAPVSPDDFFTEDGTPKIAFAIKNKITSQFCFTCINCTNELREDFPNQSIILENQYLKPFHAPTPMKKSTLDKVWQKHFKNMMAHVNIKRNLFTDFNQYIFTDFQILSGEYIKIEPLGVYSQLDKNIDIVLNLIKSDVKLLCLNDVSTTDQKSLPKIRGAFAEKYKTKSKFEK